MASNKPNLERAYTFLSFLILMSINVFVLAGCGNTPQDTQNEVAQTSKVHKHGLQKQSSSEKRLSQDKELYADETFMLGKVHAVSEATGENPFKLAVIEGGLFEKEHHVSEQRMGQIMKQGEKENWPDNYSTGEGMEKMQLRDKRYKFEGDL